jgi:hypothetical protein
VTHRIVPLGRLDDLDDRDEPSVAHDATERLGADLTFDVSISLSVRPVE